MTLSRRRSGVGSLAVVVLTVLEPSVAASESQVSGAPFSRCEVVVQPGTVFGSLQDEVGLTFMDDDRATLLADGGLAVAPQQHPGTVAIFGSEGRYLRSIGRPGEGPEEISRIETVVEREPGELVVFHVRGVTTMDLEGRVRRETKLPLRARDAWVTSEGRLVVWGFMIRDEPVSAADPAHLLHVLDRDFEPITSFAGFDPMRQPRIEQFVRAAPARDGGVWYARPNRYELSHWSNGAVEAFSPGNVAFQPWLEEPRGSPFLEPPPTAITDVDQDSNGRIWILVRVPAETWRRFHEPPRIGDVGAISGQLATRIDVLDVPTGSLVARARVSKPIQGFVGPGVGSSIGEDGNGVVQIRTWHLGLECAGG